MSQSRLAPSEVRILEQSLSAALTSCSIRLREGEHQYGLAQTIAASQLKLRFLDTKGIITHLYGDEKTSDIQLVRKIQTILKKMEKSNIVRILPKKRPWDLQRYGIVSFRFEDVEKNHVILATDEQIKQAQALLRDFLADRAKTGARKTRGIFIITMLALALTASYSVGVFATLRHTFDFNILVLSVSISTVLALALGKMLAREW